MRARALLLSLAITPTLTLSVESGSAPRASRIIDRTVVCSS
jgi:hypothetical protein